MTAIKLPDSVIEWMRTGQRGNSSDAMVEHLFGLPLRRQDRRDRPLDHPHDPGDLARCQALIEASPEVAARFPSMADASPWWGALVPAWGELVSLLDQEVPDWREGWSKPASRCYNRMLEVLGEARE